MREVPSFSLCWFHLIEWCPMAEDNRTPFCDRWSLDFIRETSTVPAFSTPQQSNRFDVSQTNNVWRDSFLPAISSWQALESEREKDHLNKVTISFVQCLRMFLFSYSTHSKLFEFAEEFTFDFKAHCWIRTTLDEYQQQCFLTLRSLSLSLSERVSLTTLCWLSSNQIPNSILSSLYCCAN